MSKGFYFDMERCVGCRVCQIACKDRLGIEHPGALTRRVRTYCAGTYPDVMVYHTTVSCNHCENPACVSNCPTGAMYKDEEGIVVHDDATCIGCETCVAACPYEAPQYSEGLDLIVKCDTCKALREAGMNPVCVDACIARALDFGEMEDLKAKYGDGLVSELPSIGAADATSPNLYIRAKKASLSEDFKENVI